MTKATSAEDNGYGVYDLYDLGEFDQKGTVRTKYGTKQELIDAIAACHKNGIAVYVDLVMNHKAGADETERFRVVQVDEMDRTKDISKPFEIEGWTKFTFSGREINTLRSSGISLILTVPITTKSANVPAFSGSSARTNHGAITLTMNSAITTT